MSESWRVSVTVDGPGATLTSSVEYPAYRVEGHGFDGLEEAAHELVGSMVEDLRETDRMIDGEWCVPPVTAPLATLR